MSHYESRLYQSVHVQEDVPGWSHSTVDFEAFVGLRFQKLGRNARCWRDAHRYEPLSLGF